MHTSFWGLEAHGVSATTAGCHLHRALLAVAPSSGQRVPGLSPEPRAVHGDRGLGLVLVPPGEGVQCQVPKAHPVASLLIGTGARGSTP